jgi:hypothetical protein
MRDLRTHIAGHFGRVMRMLDAQDVDSAEHYLDHVAATEGTATRDYLCTLIAQRKGIPGPEYPR